MPADQPDLPQGSGAQPRLRIVKGNPSDEEVAALVITLSALGGDPAPPARPGPIWAAHHRKARVTYRRGPGGWRSSGQPR